MASKESEQISELLKLLLKTFIPGPSNRALLAELGEMVAKYPKHSGNSLGMEDMVADNICNGLELVLGRSTSAGHLPRFQEVRRQLMAAGSESSALAGFKYKGSLLELFKRLHGLEIAPDLPPASSTSASDAPRSTAVEYANTATAPNTGSSTNRRANSRNSTSAMPSTAREASSIASVVNGRFPVEGSSSSDVRTSARSTPGTALVSAPETSTRTAAAAVATVTSFSSVESPAVLQTRSSADFVSAASIGQLQMDDEAALCKDLIYVLQGIDGTFIKLDAARDCYTVDATKIAVSAAAEATIYEIAEVGWMYGRLVRQLGNGPSAGQPPAPVGLVRQAYTAAVRGELEDYFRLLALLDSEVSSVPAFGWVSGSAMGGSEREESSTHPASSSGASRWSLRRMQHWSSEPAWKMRLLCTLSDAVDAATGGALLSILHSHYQNGNGRVAEVVGRILAKASTPWFVATRDWMLTGELKAPPLSAPTFTTADPGAESSRSTTACSSEVLGEEGGEYCIRAVSGVPTDRMWHDGFAVVDSQTPTFWTPSFLRSICDAGKAVHFIRRVCLDAQWVAETLQGVVKHLQDGGVPLAASATSVARHASLTSARDLSSTHTSHRDASASTAHDTDVLALVAAVSTEHALLLELEGSDPSGLRGLEALLAVVSPLVNRRLLSLLFEEHHLVVHLRAIQRYMLLTQGDFVSILVAAVGPELDKPAGSASLARHSLEAVVETAIRASNAQHEEKEVLRRLSVRLLRPSSGDSGWDVFMLQYDLPSALLGVISTGAMEAYAKLFHFLWRVKRVEHTLSVTWSAHMSASHSLRSLRHGGLNGILHMCHLLRTDMTNCIANLVSYLTYEVLASSWQDFEAQLGVLETLDDVIGAHEAYVAAIIDRALLSPRTQVIARPVQALLRDMLRFCNLQTGILGEAQEQVASRRAAEGEMAKRSASGAWGVPAGVDDMDALDDRINGALNSIVLSFGPPIAEVARSYRSRMVELLGAMQTAAHTDGLEELRMLVLRFDYNDYYGSHTPSESESFIGS